MEEATINAVVGAMRRAADDPVTVDWYGTQGTLSVRYHRWTDATGAVHTDATACLFIQDVGTEMFTAEDINALEDALREWAEKQEQAT